ncbi:phage N-6-adenine-methyltransferase [Vibrio hepatarius]|uniref:phage N-6-adenine-methyltransferase n=1 Tax=Vibrio hepatarius TaxID=171383 RepID=UPI001C0A2571|nr:phage N-6-adenine-methyltransferase [Vibrio hepatarius]MBU2897704.1 phage N-6-adenine-methyltransferase [Vibrio hepatarius]
MPILVHSTTKVQDKNRWATTWDCFEDGVALYGKPFQLDVAAEPATAKVNRFYTSIDWLEQRSGNLHQQGTGFTADDFNPQAKIVGFDALRLPWENDWWCNPPFDLKQLFIRKAFQEVQNGNSGLMLLPYEPATGWWRELVDGKATAIYEPDGRYNFLDIDGVTQKRGVNFPSAFVLWTPHHMHYTPKIPFTRGVSGELGVNFRTRLREVA